VYNFIDIKAFSRGSTSLDFFFFGKSYLNSKPYLIHQGWTDGAEWSEKGVTGADLTAGIGAVRRGEKTAEVFYQVSTNKIKSAYYKERWGGGTEV